MGDGNPFERFVKALAGDQTALSAALRALLPESELQVLERILAHETGLTEPGKNLQRLLDPISEIPRKGFNWAGKTSRAATHADARRSTLTPKASVKASARVLPGPSYEFKGAPGIAVGFKTPPSFSQLSASRQRTVQNRLLVKFSHPEDTRVVEAMSDDLPVIAKLNDPESLLEAGNFKSLKLTTSGKVRFGAALKARRSWVQSLDAPDGTVATRLKANAGYAMNWERTGDFRFTMSRARDGRLRIWLTESRKSRASRSLSLGAELKIRGLQQSVAPVMKEIARLPDHLDGLVKTYSRPSRLFRDKLRKNLNASDPSLRALTDIVAGGGKPAARRLVNSLIDAMVASAGARADHWTDLLAGRIDTVVEEGLNAVPLPPDRRDELTTHVKGKVSEALDDLNESLLRDLKAALREDAKPITATLARFAEGPSELFDRLDASAEHCLTPLKRLLARYRTLEERIVRAVETAEKEQLTIRYGRAVSRSTAASTLLRLRFDPHSEEGKSLYRQMLRGDFADAMTAGMDDDNDTITLEDCVFKRTFQRKVASGLTFNLFGREVASRRTLSTQIKAEHGIGGQINLFEAEADVSEEHAAFGESQSMRVGSLLHFIASPDAPDAFSVQLNYTDKSITPKELREYLASLEDAGLIADGATERNKIVNGLIDTPDTGERVVTINTALSLSRNELLEITENDVDAIARVAIDEQLKSWRRIPWADNALARLAKASNHDISELIFAWRDYSRSRIKRNLGITGTRMSKTQRHILYLVRGIGERAEELAGFIAHWRRLDRIGRSVNDQVERLDDARLGEIRELHQDLIADLSAWVDARNWIVGLSREDVSPVAAAFLASLRKLSPGADEPLIPVIAWTDDGETRHMAVV